MLAVRRVATRQAQETDTLVAQIEARWASRRGARPSGGSGAVSKSKGTMSDRRRARERVAAPWLAAPWVQAAARRPPPQQQQQQEKEQ